MLFPRLQLSSRTFLPWRQAKAQHSLGFPHFSRLTRCCVSFMGLPQDLVSQLLTFRHRAGILWKDCAREGDCTMEIAGLQSLTLLDYPGKVACTVFFAGCNLRCPYCHNAALVLPGLSPPPRTEESLLDLPPEPPGEARRRVPHRRGADAPEGLAGAHRQNPRHGLSRQARHQRHKAGGAESALGREASSTMWPWTSKTPLTATPRPAGRTFWPR